MNYDDSYDDEEDNIYSLMLVPYHTDKGQLNIKVGMAFPFADDEEDETHVQMIGSLTLLATAFKWMQEDEKFAAKLIKKSKGMMEDFKQEMLNNTPKVKQYLDEEKKVVKPSFKGNK